MFPLVRVSRLRAGPGAARARCWRPSDSSDGRHRADSGWQADVTSVSDARAAALRNSLVGFVFQDYSLVSHLSVLDNVLLPSVRRAHLAPHRASCRARPTGRRRARGFDAGSPASLSGGEQQRVAVARALVRGPKARPGRRADWSARHGDRRGRDAPPRGSHLPVWCFCRRGDPRRHGGRFTRPPDRAAWRHHARGRHRMIRPLRSALHDLRARPLRTVLTALSMLVGVLAVVGVSAADQLSTGYVIAAHDQLRGRAATYALTTSLAADEVPAAEEWLSGVRTRIGPQDASATLVVQSTVRTPPPAGASVVLDAQWVSGEELNDLYRRPVVTGGWGEAGATGALAVMLNEAAAGRLAITDLTGDRAPLGGRGQQPHRRRHRHHRRRPPRADALRVSHRRCARLAPGDRGRRDHDATTMRSPARWTA